ncbi:MAG: DUF1992 domain-containing protein [Acidimicrobiia bacterium]|nr:DUF1992 domain-containing protein [Acidimicrobiia bacterium]
MDEVTACSSSLRCSSSAVRSSFRRRCMGFERNADRLIREAMAEGRFDIVADGRAIDLDSYFSLPEDRRMAYSVLKSAGCVPQEVEYLRDVDRLRRALDELQSEAERPALQRALANAELQLRLALERGRRR